MVPPFRSQGYFCATAIVHKREGVNRFCLPLWQSGFWTCPFYCTVVEYLPAMSQRDHSPAVAKELGWFLPFGSSVNWAFGEQRWS